MKGSSLGNSLGSSLNSSSSYRSSSIGSSSNSFKLIYTQLLKFAYIYVTFKNYSNYYPCTYKLLVKLLVKPLPKVYLEI